MVIRVNKTKDFTVLSNAHLRDENMSLKAKGLLTLMLALPEDWEYSIEGLAKLCLEGETAIKSGLKELQKLGYVVITKKLPNETESGRIEYIYDIFETPQAAEKTRGEKQGVEILPLEILPLEIQPLEIQPVENLGQLNTNKLNTNNQELNNNIPPIIPPFDRFWEAYPKKVGRSAALKAFKRAKISDDLLEIILEHIAARSQTREWQECDGRYILHPARFLSERRWTDEIEPIAKTDEKPIGFDTDDFFNKAVERTNRKRGVGNADRGS